MSMSTVETPVKADNGAAQLEDSPIKEPAPGGQSGPTTAVLTEGKGQQRETPMDWTVDEIKVLLDVRRRHHSRFFIREGPGFYKKAPSTYLAPVWADIAAEFEDSIAKGRGAGTEPESLSARKKTVKDLQNKIQSMTRAAKKVRKTIRSGGGKRTPELKRFETSYWKGVLEDIEDIQPPPSDAMDVSCVAVLPTHALDSSGSTPDRAGGRSGSLLSGGDAKRQRVVMPGESNSESPEAVSSGVSGSSTPKKGSRSRGGHTSPPAAQSGSALAVGTAGARPKLQGVTGSSDSSPQPTAEQPEFGASSTRRGQDSELLKLEEQLKADRSVTERVAAAVEAVASLTEKRARVLDLMAMAFEAQLKNADRHGQK